MLLFAWTTLSMIILVVAMPHELVNQSDGLVDRLGPIAERFWTILLAGVTHITLATIGAVHFFETTR